MGTTNQIVHSPDTTLFSQDNTLTPHELTEIYTALQRVFPWDTRVEQINPELRKGQSISKSFVMLSVVWMTQTLQRELLSQLEHHIWNDHSELLERVRLFNGILTQLNVKTLIEIPGTVPELLEKVIQQVEIIMTPSDIVSTLDFTTQLPLEVCHLLWNSLRAIFPETQRSRIEQIASRAHSKSFVQHVLLELSNALKEELSSMDWTTHQNMIALFGRIIEFNHILAEYTLFPIKISSIYRQVAHTFSTIKQLGIISQK
jgi:hypothetical protein